MYLKRREGTDLKSTRKKKRMENGITLRWYW